MDITERFFNYTKFDTQSSEESESVPSTSKQLIFANYLKEELEREGLSDVEMDEMGYIYATLKANTKKKKRKPFYAKTHPFGLLTMHIWFVSGMKQL